MKNTKRIFYTLIIAITLGGLAGGCANSEESADLQTFEKNEELTEVKDSSEEAVLDLTDWMGSWNSITYYLDEQEVQGAYEELADREDITIEAAKGNYQRKVLTDFTAIVIEENQITYLDGLENEGGKVIETVEYEYQEEQTIEHGGQKLSWFKFIAKEEAMHATILLLDVHGEESMPHFHFRYGEADEDLLEKEDWYPTLISPRTTLDQVYEDIAD